MAEVNILYTASPTMSRFHQSTAFVRGVRGPIGSGKSVGCCFEIFAKMMAQEPGSDGVRRTRWAVVRNTNPQLETTTIKTWLDWFREDLFGRFLRKVPFLHNVSYGPLEDGTYVAAEVYFIALDRPEDVKKLLSLELTGVWINEAREVALEIISAAIDRVGRYPSMREGGPSWYGVIMDTNSPEEDHWWAVYSGDAPLPEGWTEPTNWEIFTQPPAAFERKKGKKITFELNPDAENLANLTKDYYYNIIHSGKTLNHIRVYVCNKYGSLSDGRPIYGDEWNQEIHISPTPLEWNRGSIIHVGLDFGNTPSAIFNQRMPNTQWQTLRELVCSGIGAERFASMIKLMMSQEFPNTPPGLFRFWGDPSGQSNLQGQERSYFDILRANGIGVMAPPGLINNDPTFRIEAGRSPLNRAIRGEPGYLIDPRCKMMIAGFNGKYRFKKISMGGGVSRFDDNAEKNDWSHPHEAHQYGLIGGGEARNMVGRKKMTTEVIKAKIGKVKM